MLIDVFPSVEVWVMRFRNVFLVGLLALTIVSCSHTSPVVPENQIQDTSTSLAGEISNRSIWGFWNVAISADHSTATITPVRTAGMHLNIVGLLENSPCSNCLTVTNIHSVGAEELRCDLTLTHPIAGILKLSGFDVRGIFIAGSDYNFPTENKYIAHGENLPRLYNHDGYTNLFNPTDFDPDGLRPDFLKYIPGKFTKPGDLSSTLCPFLAYAEDQPRRIFLPGEIMSRTVILKVPMGEIEFGYAVDACWTNVYGTVIDPVAEFPQDANCLEPYKIKVDSEAGLGTVADSRTKLNIEVFDHQGFDNIPDVYIEAPDLFEGRKTVLFSGHGEQDNAFWNTSIKNEYGVAEGMYPLLVRVTDNDPDQNLGEVDAWQVAMIRVGDIEGWVKTWGGSGRDAAWDTAIDEDGNIYLVGEFTGSVDFDTGSGVDLHTAPDGLGAFLCKYTPAGEYLWTVTWGKASARALIIDDSGNPNVTGNFEGTCDFDPGDGVEEIQADGLKSDVYVSRFDSDGNFQWVATWGAANVADLAGDIACGDMGSVYVAGCFSSTVDFDPGPGTEERTSNGEEDVFLVKLDFYGDLEWVNTWGGIGGVSFATDDEACGLACSDSGIYVGGHFHSECDFDPGTGEMIKIPNGYEDAYIAKFSASGTFQWVNTWGGVDATSVKSLSSVDSTGVLATGYFNDIVDFDPGDDVLEFETNGTPDGFVTSYNKNGGFEWAVPITSWATVIPNDLTIDSTGDIVVTGFFDHYIDLDPGPGIDGYESEGWMDVFLLKLDYVGIYEWGHAFGGPGVISEYVDDEGCSVITNNANEIFLVGHFEYLTDFEPGPGEEIVTSNGLWDAWLTRYRPDGTW